MPMRMLAQSIGRIGSAHSRIPLQASKTIGCRSASTSSGPSPLRNVVTSTLLLAGGVAFVAYYYDSRSLLHERVAMPIVRLFDAERGHKMAVQLLSNKWLRPRDRGQDGPELSAQLFGLPLSNPVGVAAGFDKDAECIDGLFDLGFGYVEVGSVTPEPQPGNPTPRFFRLVEDEAAINRYGFNSLGHAHTLARLRARVLDFSRSHPSMFPSPLPYNPLPPTGLPRSLRPGQLLAVNLGKNKTSAADSNEDYIRGVRKLGPYADIVVINVSSPNTPGLRALQGREQLQRLLGDVVNQREQIKVDGLPKIAVKVAADLSEEELADVAAAVRSSGVEGVIVSNTTTRRKELDLQSEYASEVGGLSGKPLFPYALNALRTLRPLLPPSIPIIGCGGISSGSDALQMANAGASIIQVYTHFGYRGVGTPRLIKDEITAALGSGTWKASIGTEYQGSHMIWDEKRLTNEADKLKAEAQGLGDMLRKKWHEDDVARLVAEAEAALSGEGGARDNLAGAEPSAAPSAPAEIKQLEGRIVQAIEAISSEQEPPSPEPLLIETKPSTPIIDQPNVGLDPAARNEWRDQVKSSQRRLV